MGALPSCGAVGGGDGGCWGPCLLHPLAFPSDVQAWVHLGEPLGLITRHVPPCLIFHVSQRRFKPLKADLQELYTIASLVLDPEGGGGPHPPFGVGS